VHAHYCDLSLTHSLRVQFQLTSVLPSLSNLYIRTPNCCLVIPKTMRALLIRYRGNASTASNITRWRVLYIPHPGLCVAQPGEIYACEMTCGEKSDPVQINKSNILRSTKYVVSTRCSSNELLFSGKKSVRSRLRSDDSMTYTELIERGIFGTGYRHITTQRISE